MIHNHCHRVYQCVIVALACATFALPLAAQETSKKQESDSPPTAEDVLRELKKRRPTNPVIPPASWEDGKPIEEPKLLPEGTLVMDRSGRLERGDNWWLLILDKLQLKNPDDPENEFLLTTDSIKLLPNTTLEELIQMSQAASEPMYFSITGEITEFRGENYLLARSAVRAKHESVSQSAATNEETNDDDQAPAPSADAVKSDASAVDVLERMKGITPSHPVMPARDSMSDVDDERFASGGHAIFEGTPLERRTGRLVTQGDWWAFAFDSNRIEQAEPQLRLLPNQRLQYMVDLYEREPAGLVFTLSGEVTEFNGRNYVLVRTVTRRLDLGNLRR